MRLTFFLLMVSLTSFGQSIKIGNLTFMPIQQEGKPKETVRGQIEVFEDNIKNTGKKIKLNIEVIPSTALSKEDPMFIIMGGPGQAATDLISFFCDIFKPINSKSDLVFIDQRGTGKSNPLQLAGTYNSLNDYFKDDFASNAVIEESYEKIKKENDLNSYGTFNAILDLETVRKEMGYEKINLYGTSYGTRVSIAYINKYPKKVRTATLKGLVPPDLAIPLEFAENSQRSLDILLKDCKENQVCNSAFPDLENEVKNFFNKQFPFTFELINPDTHKKETIKLSKEIIALNLRVLLMSPSTAAQIPFLITEFNKGNYEPLATTILEVKRSYLKGVYDGMTLCVICTEDYPISSREDAKENKKTFLGDYWMYRVMNACKIWNSEKKESKKIEIRKQDIPVLLISGNRDAATPPKYGDAVLKYFPNGKHIVINSGSHSFSGMRNCIENIICDFVITGQNHSLKTDCVDLIKFPGYKVN